MIYDSVKKGQVYKYPDGKDLYLVMSMDMLSCNFLCLMNLNTAEFIWISVDDDERLVEGMEKVADDVNKLIRKRYL